MSSSFDHQGSIGNGEIIVCDEIVVLLADPLVVCYNDKILRSFPSMTISRKDILTTLTNALPKQVCIDFKFATRESLQSVICDRKDSKNRIVHLLYHGDEGVLNLETNQGDLSVITPQYVKDLCQPQHIHLMMISACHSKEIGQAFVDAGVSHVICCRGKISDFAVTTFAKMFYQKLSHCTIQESFRFAQLAVKHIPSSIANEEEQFILLSSDDGYHQRRFMFKKTEDMTQSENVDYSSFLLRFPKLSSNFLGRRKEVFLINRNYHKSVIHLKGKSGIGKSALATFVAIFGLERRIYNSVAWFPPRFSFPCNDSRHHEMPSHDDLLDLLLQQLWHMIRDKQSNFDNWILSFIQYLKNIQLFLVVDIRCLENYHETILPDILEILTKENIDIKILIISKDLEIKKPTMCFDMELKPLTFQDMVTLFAKCSPQVEPFNTSYKQTIASSTQELQEKIFRRDICKDERGDVEVMSKREAELFFLLGNGNPKTIESQAKDEEACMKIMELAEQYDETGHELETSLDWDNTQSCSNSCLKSKCSSAKMDTKTDPSKNCKKNLLRECHEIDEGGTVVGNKIENMIANLGSQEVRHQSVPTAALRSTSRHPSKKLALNDVGAAPPNTHATQQNVKYVFTKGALVSFSSSRFSKVGIVVASNECCSSCTGVLGDVTKHGGEALKMEVEKLKKLPNGKTRCQTGNAVIVGQEQNKYGSLNIPYIIFAVAPNKVHNKDIRNQLLKDAYQNALKLAEKNKLDAIAFSLLGAGNRCTEQQKEEVIRIGVDALFSFTGYCNLKEVYHYCYNDEEVHHLIKICKERL